MMTKIERDLIKIMYFPKTFLLFLQQFHNFDFFRHVVCVNAAPKR